MTKIFILNIIAYSIFRTKYKLPFWETWVIWSEWKRLNEVVTSPRYTHLCLHTTFKMITWRLLIKSVFYGIIVSEFSAGGDFLCSFIKETFLMRSPFRRINSSIFGISYFTYIMTLFNNSSRTSSLHINKTLLFYFFCSLYSWYLIM